MDLIILTEKVAAALKEAEKVLKHRMDHWVKFCVICTLPIGRFHPNCQKGQLELGHLWRDLHSSYLKNKKTSRAILKASWNCIKSRSCHTLAWVDIELVIASRQNQCSAPLQFSTCCLCSNSSPQTLFYYWNVSFTLLEIVLNASAPPKFSWGWVKIQCIKLLEMTGSWPWQKI